MSRLEKLKRVAVKSFIMPWLTCLIYSTISGAQANTEIVDGNGQWQGELRFAVDGQDDVSCPIVVSLKNYRLHDSFACFSAWWLPPGRTWSIEGVVSSDGDLEAAAVKWGYATYSVLAGSLREAKGTGNNGVSPSSAVGNVELTLSLGPEPGAIRIGDAQELAALNQEQENTGNEETGEFDGIYTGKKHCPWTSGDLVYVFRVNAKVVGGTAQVIMTATGKYGQYDEFKFAQPLDGKGIVRYDLSESKVSGSAVTLRLANATPSAVINDECEFELDKLAVK